jgi:hypothetical protein
MDAKIDKRNRSSTIATGIAFSLLVLGVLPVAAIQSGLYQVGMCDPAPLLSLVWLGACGVAGTGFGGYSVYRVESLDRRMLFPILAAILNIAAFFIPVLLLLR